MSCWLKHLSQLESYLSSWKHSHSRLLQKGFWKVFQGQVKESSFQFSQVSEKQPRASMWTLFPSKREHEGCSLALCHPNGRRLSMPSANPVSYSQPLLRHNHHSPGKRQEKSPEATTSKCWPVKQIGTAGLMDIFNTEPVGLVTHLHWFIHSFISRHTFVPLQSQSGQRWSIGHSPSLQKLWQSRSEIRNSHPLAECVPQIALLLSNEIFFFWNIVDLFYFIFLANFRYTIQCY